ncbi:hypothetical protein ACJO1H_14185 [Vibrio parahaemolyticus]|uniref:hypothetical protein n=1 Tax=Vibrio parahaemolyticus TaxID=670 RepID=UPI0028097D3F|nr:hypothetical protein [Vibrio parahaemolyticus]
MSCCICDTSVRNHEVAKSQVREVIKACLDSPYTTSKSHRRNMSDLPEYSRYVELLCATLDIVELPGKNVQDVDLNAVFEWVGLKPIEFGKHCHRTRTINALTKLAATKRQGARWCNCQIQKREKSSELELSTKAHRQLSKPIREARERIASLEDIDFITKKNKGNSELSLRVRMKDQVNSIKKRFVGKNVLAECENYINALDEDRCAYFYNIQALNSPEAVSKFETTVKTYINKNFKDSDLLENLYVIHAKNIVPEQRSKFAARFKSKERHYLQIFLKNGSILRITFRTLKQQCQYQYLTGISLGLVMRERRDILRQSLMLLGSPSQITSLSETNPREFEIAFHKGRQSQSITLDTRTNYLDLPMLLLEEDDRYLHASTHLIFYIWAAKEKMFYRKQTIYKFGITRVNLGDIDKQDWLNQCKSAVKRRKEDYAFKKGLRLSWSRLLLISNPVSLGSKNEEIVRALENALKRSSQNAFLDVRETRKQRFTSEVMCGEETPILDRVQNLANDKSTKVKLILADNVGNSLEKSFYKEVFLAKQ